MRNLDSWEPYLEQSGPSQLWGVRVAGGGRTIIKASTALDGEDVSLVARTHNSRLARPDQINVNSIVSARTGMPVYQFSFGAETWELELRAMRAYIDDMYQALEAGLSDAFIVHFVRERMLPEAPRADQDRTVGALMQEFRQFRELLNNPPPVEGSERES